MKISWRLVLPCLTRMAGLCVFVLLPTVTRADPFGDAVGQPDLAWKTSAKKPWIVQSTDTHDGISALQSTYYDGTSGASTLSITNVIRGPVTVNFWWKVDSLSAGTGDDFVFSFGALNLADNFDVSNRRSIRGQPGWQRISVSIESGDYLLSWSCGRYAQGWMDEVTFTEPLPSAPRLPGNPSPAKLVLLAGGTIRADSRVAGFPIIAQWLRNGQPVAGQTNASLVISNSRPSDTGDYQLRLSNALGVATSRNVLVDVVAPVTFRNLARLEVPGGPVRRVGLTRVPAPAGSPALHRTLLPAGVAGKIPCSDPLLAWYQTDTRLTFLVFEPSTGLQPRLDLPALPGPAPCFAGRFCYFTDGPGGVRFFDIGETGGSSPASGQLKVADKILGLVTMEVGGVSYLVLHTVRFFNGPTGEPGAANLLVYRLNANGGIAPDAKPASTFTGPPLTVPLVGQEAAVVRKLVAKGDLLVMADNATAHVFRLTGGSGELTLVDKTPDKLNATLLTSTKFLDLGTSEGRKPILVTASDRRAYGFNLAAFPMTWLPDFAYGSPAVPNGPVISGLRMMGDQLLFGLTGGGIGIVNVTRSDDATPTVPSTLQTGSTSIPGTLPGVGTVLASDPCDHQTIIAAAGSILEIDSIAPPPVESCFAIEPSLIEFCPGTDPVEFKFKVVRIPDSPEGDPSTKKITLRGYRFKNPQTPAKAVETQLTFPPFVNEVEMTATIDPKLHSIGYYSIWAATGTNPPACHLKEQLVWKAKVCAPCIGFAGGTVEVDEGPTQKAILTVRSERSPDWPVSVRYEIVRNYEELFGARRLATPGDDFLLAEGRIDFPPGQTAAEIRVPIMDDSEVEGYEYFGIRLFSPVNSNLCGETNAVVILHDNDASTTAGTTPFEPLPLLDCVSLAGGSRTICDQNGLARVTLVRTLFPGSGTEARIRVRTEVVGPESLPPGVVPAIPGTDFYATDREVTFQGYSGGTETVDVYLLVDAPTLPTQNIRRFRVRLSDPQKTEICSAGESVFVDLLPCTNGPPTLKIARQSDANGEKVIVDWSPGGVPGFKRHLEGGFEPLVDPVRPQISYLEWIQRYGGSATFFLVDRIPTDPLLPPGHPLFPPVTDGAIDFGDVPVTYEELPVFGPPGKAANPRWPAGHVIAAGFALGGLVDGDVANQPTALADGDDRKAFPDEDGVVFNRPLFAGGEAQVTVTASQAGFLDAWIDYDGDGSFLNGFPPGLRFADNSLNAGIQNPRPNAPAPGASHPLAPGPNVIRFLVPTNAIPRQTYARFRFSRQGKLSPLFLAPDGEVEDHRVQIQGYFVDFGDAPDDGVLHRYPTRLNNAGAFHVADSTGFLLGKTLDFEADARPTTDARGDNEDLGTLAAGQPANGDDEDGLTGNQAFTPGSTTVVPVFATVRSVQEGRLDAWLDWNRDGDWEDAGEHCLSAQRIIDGANSFSIQVPATAIRGLTYLRLRLTREGIDRPGGPVLGGEVEDYAVVIGP